MTDTFAYVDPTNVATIEINDLDSIPLELRGRPSIGVRLPIEGSGVNSRSFQLGEDVVPEFDVYARTLDEAPLPGPRNYYTPVDALSFVGTVKDPAAQVVDSRTWDQIAIDDLYDLKRSGIASQDRTVRYNAVDTSLAANWWIIVTQDGRNEIYGINGNWVQRQIDGKTWPAGATNAPWIGIFNENNSTSRREQVLTSDIWETLFGELTGHDQLTGNATSRSQDALDAAYDDGNGVWQAVADHDPADPAWDYPPTVSLSNGV